MERHIDMVALLFLVYGALLVVLAAVLLIVLGPGGAPTEVSTAPGSVWTELAYRTPEAALTLTVIAVPFILTAWGLRRRAGAARIAALVLGGLSILSFPIGTALGGYSIWVLTRPEAASAFADQSPAPDDLASSGDVPGSSDSDAELMQ
jgi:hypothetical protein